MCQMCMEYSKASYCVKCIRSKGKSPNWGKVQLRHNIVPNVCNL